ncbi:MAG: DnaA N-terminal domain-containing protein, partial [Bacteroidota bacterium]
MMQKTKEEVWGGCLSVIRDNVTQQSFKTWFEPIQPVRLQEGVLTIQVPSQFFYEWLEEHYITLLKKTIRHELGPNGRLEYSIVVDGSYAPNPVTVNMPAS